MEYESTDLEELDSSLKNFKDECQCLVSDSYFVILILVVRSLRAKSEKKGCAGCNLRKHD